MNAALPLIASKDNPRFKALLKLATTSRERRERGLSVIEGVHLIEAALQHGVALREMFLPSDAMPEGEAQRVVRRTGLEATLLAPALFKAVSQVEQGGGPLALIETPQEALPERISSDCVILEDVQDPGNLGAILRTCAAAGVRLVLLSHTSVYAWSPKVLRSAMGAHFALTIVEGIDCHAALARLDGVTAWVTALDGAQSLYGEQLRAPSAWIFGNEGSGVSPALQAAAQRRVKIPQAAHVESLNVAAAVAVCLFEQLRQRQTS